MSDSTKNNQSRTNSHNPTIDCTMDLQSSNKNDLSEKISKVKMTVAFKQLLKDRDAQHPESVRIIAHDLSTVVYICPSKTGLILAAGYRGRSRKLAFYTNFRSLEIRNNYIKEWMNKNTLKKDQPKRDLKVGDVLSACWGYEQTNRGSVGIRVKRSHFSKIYVKTRPGILKGTGFVSISNINCPNRLVLSVI